MATTAKKAPAADPADPGPAAEPSAAKKRAVRQPKDISHLPVRETRLIPDEVKANPDAYREIDRTIQRFDSKAAQQVVSDRDEMHDGRHTTGTTTLSDYQDELSGASCQSFGLGR